MSKIMNSLNKFLKYLLTGPINMVSNIFVFSSFLLIGLWIFVKSQFFPTLPKTYNYLVLMISSIVVGSLGLIYIKRKEMPGPLSSIIIKGKLAIIGGVLLILLFWGLGVLGLVSSLIK